MSFAKRVISVIFLSVLFAVRSLYAQEQQTDSLVRLISARSAQLLEINGTSYRKVVGPARFLHNNTYLLCDTALWNMDTQVIDAMGNVSIIQNGTELTSDDMIYYVNDNLAEFRGNIVQLRDRDNNMLRTRHLDYNTKDSVAVFQNGGSMRDKDGQIIESRNGTYDSKIETFTFSTDVNMFTDSIFVKTSTLKYESPLNLATFGRGTDAWQDDNMLSSNAGWYDRGKEVFFFKENVHIMTGTQEGWCDSLYFYRNTVDVKMLGNAQVTDTSRNVSAVAGCIDYIDTLSKVTLTRDPAVISEIAVEDRIDTVYFGADTLIYYTMRYCDIDSVTIENSGKRLKDLEGDPVSTFRKKSAEAAAKAAEEEAMNNDPNYRPKQAKKKEELPDVESDSLAVADSLTVTDSLAVQDSLAATIVPEPDTTKIGFLTALGNVKIFRPNMQVVCDSLEYSDIDSLARLFKEPVIWNEIKQQYSADSITVVVKNSTMDKASLMSEAFILIQEDKNHFDQIKSTEMLAYFSESSELERFDALGGASAIFFIKEQDVLATVNKKESKMLNAVFKDGEIQRVYYFEGVKSDVYPLAQMSEEEQVLKGFNWLPDKRPEDRYAVTSMELRPVERERYAARPRARYTQTDIYFPGYMDNIYVQIAFRDSLAQARDEQRRIEQLRKENELQLHKADSLSNVADSLLMADSLNVAADSLKANMSDSLAVADSLSAVRMSDSLSVSDSIVVKDAVAKIGKEELRRQKKAERDAVRAARIEAKEGRWAELDRLDAEKKAAKQAEKEARLRERKRKMLEAAEKQARKDASVVEHYLRKIEKKAARKEAKAKVSD